MSSEHFDYRRRLGLLLIFTVTLAGLLSLATLVGATTDGEVRVGEQSFQETNQLGTSGATLQAVEVGANTKGLEFEQNINVLVLIEGGESDTIVIDTAELSDMATLEPATVESELDAEIVAQTNNRTEIKVVNPDDSRRHGEVLLQLPFTKDTQLEREVTYVIESETGGDSIEKTTTLYDAESKKKQISAADGEAVVFVAVRDEDGNQLTGEDVEVWGEAQEDVEWQITGGNLFPDGTFILRPQAHTTYDIYAMAPGYAAANVTDQRFDEEKVDEPIVIQLEPGASITGTVVDEGGDPIEGATVEVSDGTGERLTTKTDADGSYHVTVSPGEYMIRTHADDAVGTYDEPLRVNSSDDAKSVDLQAVEPRVVEASLEHVGGTEPDLDQLDVYPYVSRGLMFVQVGDGSGSTLEDGVSRDALTPTDLSAYGADETTELEVTITVEHYDPDSLLWAADDVDWETQPSETTEGAVDITIRARPVHIEMTDSAPFGPVQDGDSVDWPINDTADRGAERGIQVVLYELSNLHPDMREYLRGMSATTNAQAFGLPTVEDGELSVYVGGPSERMNGDTHEGFYSVFLPSPLLEEWNVDDPESDLTVNYKGESENFDVETADDGVWIHLDPISYSDGVISVRSTAGGEASLIEEFWYVYGELTIAVAALVLAVGLLVGIGLRIR